MSKVNEILEYKRDKNEDFYALLNCDPSSTVSNDAISTPVTYDLIKYQLFILHDAPRKLDHLKFSRIIYDNDHPI